MNNGSRYISDYTEALSDGRATRQRSWETEIGTVVQNDFETVTRHYVTDYLSVANRDIPVTEDGSFVQRYVYDEDGTRISAEFGHADGTARGTANADGEYGENIASDTAVNVIGKVWYRSSLLGSTLFAVDADGEVRSHSIYDPWGNPLTNTYTDINFSGLDNANNYTGYTWDETLKIYFAQNRFYDAKTHRFTQEDIAKDGANWYVYCSNNLANSIDFYGLASGIRYVPEDKDLKRFGRLDLVAAANYVLWQFGFEYDRNANYFYAREDGWQRKFGYMDLFDKYMNYVPGIEIDALPCIFDYKKKTWRLECWKGEYGPTAGGEIGLYVLDAVMTLSQYFEKMECAGAWGTGTEAFDMLFSSLKDSEVLSKNVKWYRAATAGEYIGMAAKFSKVKHKFWNGGKERELPPFVSRSSSGYWWLTAFKLYPANKEDIIMGAALRFPDNAMRDNYRVELNGKISTGYNIWDIKSYSKGISFNCR